MKKKGGGTYLKSVGRPMSSLVNLILFFLSFFEIIFLGIGEIGLPIEKDNE